MARKYKYSPITPNKWDEYYSQWVESGKDEAVFNRIIKEITPYLDMCKKSFKVLPMYWDEYHCDLVENIWRAFKEFKPDRGARFSTWVYRLASQSAWSFIKNKCKDIDRDINSVGLSTVGITSENSSSVETNYIQNEEMDIQEKQLHLILNEALRGPIEKEVFIKKMGLFGSLPMKIEEIAEDLSLTTRTVEQIITRNNNSMSLFKRWLKEQGGKTFDPELIKSYKKEKNTNKF